MIFYTIAWLCYFVWVLNDIIVSSLCELFHFRAAVIFSLFAPQNLMMLQPFATQVVQLGPQRYSVLWLLNFLILSYCRNDLMMKCLPFSFSWNYVRELFWPMEIWLQTLLGPPLLPNSTPQMCEYQWFCPSLNIHPLLFNNVVRIYSELISVCWKYLFFFASYISYLPLAHIYERANQVMSVYYGVAVGFYQGVWNPSLFFCPVLEIVEDSLNFPVPIPAKGVEILIINVKYAALNSIC